MYIHMCVLCSQKQWLSLEDPWQGFCFILPAASHLIFLSHLPNSDRLLSELSLPLGTSVPAVGHSGPRHLSGLPFPVCSLRWGQTHCWARRTTCFRVPACLSSASFPARLLHSRASLFYLFVGSSVGSFVQPSTPSLIRSVSCVPHLKTAPGMVCSLRPGCSPVLFCIPSPSSHACLAPTPSRQLLFASIFSKRSVNNPRNIY